MRYPNDKHISPIEFRVTYFTAQVYFQKNCDLVLGRCLNQPTNESEQQMNQVALCSWMFAMPHA